MVYVFGEILIWLLAALTLGGVLAVLWMRLVAGARGDERLAPLSDRIVELEVERDGLRREVGEARDRVTERETQLSALRDDLDARDSKLAGQIAELEKLREMGGAPGAASSMSPEAEALRAELEAVRRRIAERDVEINELTAELANAREAYHHLEAAQFGVGEPVAPPVQVPLAPEDESEPAPAGSTDAALPELARADPAVAPSVATQASLADRTGPSPERDPMQPAQTAAADAASRDDLTRIKGIGKVLESKLNQLGVTSFAQIAALSPADVTRLDAELTPPGRIARDDWIAQARALFTSRETGAG